jgi:hypothetical protein
MVVYPPERDARWDYRRAAVERIDAAVRQMLRNRMLLGNASASRPRAGLQPQAQILPRRGAAARPPAPRPRGAERQ